MATAAHLIRRGRIYYFRRKVPLQLRDQLGRGEIRKSLGTADPDEARARAAVEAGRLEKEFARLRAERFARRRHRAAKPGKPMTVAELFAAWNEVRERPRTTVYDFAKASRRFAALYPDVMVDMIEPAHMEAFTQAIIAEGVAAGTVRKQFGALSAMLEMAVEQGLLPDNPGRGLRMSTSVGDAQTKLAFDASELRSIFSTPVYAAGDRPQGGAGPAAYWLPLLALYTGARLGELGALRVQNVREAQGIRYLVLAGENPRSRASHRHVPLHVDLIRLGFLQFVEMQRRAGESTLFEQLRADNKGKLTGNWSKWFARYLRTVAKVKDPRKSFDSFRQSFMEACERAALPGHVQTALTGKGSGTKKFDDIALLDASVQALVFDIG